MIGNLTGESFLIALSGMVIVFLMLAILCLFIPVISKCVRFFEKRRQKPEPVRPAPAAVPQADPAPAAAQQAGLGRRGRAHRRGREDSGLCHGNRQS